MIWIPDPVTQVGHGIEGGSPKVHSGSWRGSRAEARRGRGQPLKTAFREPGLKQIVAHQALDNWALGEREENLRGVDTRMVALSETGRFLILAIAPFGTRQRFTSLGDIPGIQPQSGAWTPVTSCDGRLLSVPPLRWIPLLGGVVASWSGWRRRGCLH